MMIKIYFYDLPYWRSEILRVGLFLQGIPHKFVTDPHVLTAMMKRKKDDDDDDDDDNNNGSGGENKHPTTKKAIIAPFGQLPVMEIGNGQMISQTQAMASYVGKLGSHFDYEGEREKLKTEQPERGNVMMPSQILVPRLYPNDGDLFRQTKCDEIINGCIDVTVTIAATFQLSNEEEKETKQRELIDSKNNGGGKLYKYLFGLNTIVGVTEDCVYACGPSLDGGVEGSSSLTMADLAVWSLVGWFSTGVSHLKYVPTDFVSSNFDNLKRIYDHVQNDDRIVSYMKEKHCSMHARLAAFGGGGC